MISLFYNVLNNEMRIVQILSFDEIAKQMSRIANNCRKSAIFSPLLLVFLDIECVVKILFYFLPHSLYFDPRKFESGQLNLPEFIFLLKMSET